MSKRPPKVTKCHFWGGFWTDFWTLFWDPPKMGGFGGPRSIGFPVLKKTDRRFCRDGFFQKCLLLTVFKSEIRSMPVLRECFWALLPVNQSLIRRPPPKMAILGVKKGPLFGPKKGSFLTPKSPKWGPITLTPQNGHFVAI